MARAAIRSGLVLVVAGLIGFAAALVAAAPAHAASDPRTEKAREHYLQADAFYKLDRYPSALQEYEQAYLAKPDPSFLYNIAQCHRLMGDKAEAIKFYRRYLKDAPTAPNREVAEKHIKDLESALAAAPAAPISAATSLAPGVVAPPSGPAPAAPPMPPPVETALPMPVPQPAAPGANGTSLALAAPPPIAGPPPSGGALAAGPPLPSQDDEPPIYKRWWFWTGIGAVLAGGVIIALSAKSDPSCPAGRICQ